MDKNTWLGFLLIAAIIIGFSMLNRPSKEELAEQQRIQDSIAVAQAQEAEAQRVSQELTAQLEQNSASTTPISQDSLQVQLQAVYGTFAKAAQGTEQLVTLENEVIRLTLSTHGGTIQRAELLNYHANGDTIHPLSLFHGDESSMAFTLITANNRILQTSNFYFTPIVSNDNKKVTMRLQTEQEDAYLDFIYTLSEDYMVDFDIQANTMQTALAQNINSLEMAWQQLIPQQEKGRTFEERYSQLQYMLVGGEDRKSVV